MKNTCKCGYNYNNTKVIAKTKYSSLGWFLFTILGLSAKPIQVDFTCSICGEVIATSKEKEILSKYIGR
jgi:hypothetical protein